MRRAAVLALLAGALVAAPGAQTAPEVTLTGTWRGTFVLPRGGAPVAVSVQLRGGSGVVALGAGHPSQTVVPARRTGKRLRFALPGRPTPVRFDGRLRRAVLSGKVTQGPLRGTFTLRRGAAIDGRTAGLYALPDGRALSVHDALSGNRLGVLLDDGEVRGLFRAGRDRSSVGAGITIPGPVGELRFTGSGVTGTFGTTPIAGTRVPLRQEEVRFRSGNAWLAGTLTLPPGPGPHPAIAFAHGAGAMPRSVLGHWVSFFARLGVATLAPDKRGIGQSRGTYPGEGASPSNIDQYARDVEAAARFLAAQPDIDRARIGLSGGSQAGWIMPLAASREPAIRFLVLLVSPTISQGQTDFWASTTAHGASPPPSYEALEDEVRRMAPSGFDPLPSIRQLTIPALWLFGGKDRTVPSRVCVEALDPIAREPGRDFTSVVFPNGSHALVETADGRPEETDRANRFVPRLFTTVRAWLRARGLAPAGRPVAASGVDPALESDVRALAEQMRTTHPDLFHSISQAAFGAEVDGVVARLPSLNEDELLTELMRLVALPGERDGHTGIFPLDRSHQRPLHVYPIYLYEFSDGLHVAAEIGNRGLVGRRLVSIGGVPVDQVLTRVSPLVPRDNEWSLRSLRPEYVLVAEVLHGLGVAPDTGPLAFTLAARDGSTSDVVLEPITAASYVSALRPQFHRVHIGGLPQRSKPIHLARRRLDRWTTTFDRGRTVYGAYNLTIGYTGDFARKLRRLAARKRVQRVILDLRHNPGGNNTTYGPLLDALRSRRINRPGRLFVLIGRSTFSAAGNFAAEIDMRTQARFVGEPTGGSPNQYGDSTSFTLPATGWTVHVATSHTVRTRSDDPRLAIEPDLPASLSSEDFLAGRDPVLLAARTTPVR